MQPFYVYILECSDGSYYTGHTDNLEARISQHKIGNIAGYTSKRLPVKLVFAQTTHSREEALQAEMQIKKWSRKKKKALIEERWLDLIKLAEGNKTR